MTIVDFNTVARSGSDGMRGRVVSVQHRVDALSCRFRSMLLFIHFFKLSPREKRRPSVLRADLRVLVEMAKWRFPSIQECRYTGIQGKEDF